MDNNFIKNVIDNYDYNDINHIFSIILRAWYEKNKMEIKKINNSFKICQMNNFVVNYNTILFEFVLNNNITKISLKEMDKMVDYIYEYFSLKYPINYDYRLIDPIYFSLFFYDVIDKIIDVEYDIINISDIRLLRKGTLPVTMEKSERFRALVDKNHKMYSPFSSNLICETPEKRLENILISIKDNGYAYNGQFAIFYNNEPYLRDGQHRVSAVKYLYGDIDIKILRFHLKNNYFYD